MSFANPYAFIMLIVAILALFLKCSKQNKNISIPSYQLIRAVTPSWRIRLRTPVLLILALASLLALTIAAARPQLINTLPTPQEARNLILALDLSRSMETPDFNIDGQRATRLDGVKSVVEDLLINRSADRIGLVVFGVRAFLQAPLTLDHPLLSQMVGSLRCGVAGDGTAIGDGLGLSIKRLQQKSQRSRAVILITDGVNNSGNVNPLQAAQIANDLGIIVHTIGIGSNQPLPQDLLGGLMQFQGLQSAEFDEKLLKEIAALTGGIYSFAESSADLRKIYSKIEMLDSSREDSPITREITELFPGFALVAFFCYLILLILSRTIFLKVPLT
jgi:Ca-activated chloride channel homolog